MEKQIKEIKWGLYLLFILSTLHMSFSYHILNKIERDVDTVRTLVDDIRNFIG